MINNEKGDEKVKIMESEYKDLKSQLCSNQDKSKQFISNKPLGIRITIKFFYRHQDNGLYSGFSSWVVGGG